ncbi:hypothetical protein K438DRAFT_2013126 [Mycena galopus ATCC 62051]|nr:hypothetical protein K438DRAFT_2013126 [Mycena galopus ATCC 62051]
MAPSFVLPSLAALSTPSFPSLASSAPSSATVASVTPANAALALGLSVSIGVAFVARRLRRARRIDCEASANTTAAGTARRTSVNTGSKDDSDLYFASFFTRDGDDQEHDPVGTSWYFGDDEARGALHKTLGADVKTLGALRTVDVTTPSEAHTPLAAVVEEFQPEDLKVGHLFAATEDEEDSANDELDYGYWLFGGAVEVQQQLVPRSMPALTEAASIPAPSSAQVESDDLQFSYLFANGFDEDDEDDEEDETVDHDFDEVSGVPQGFSTAFALRAVGSQTPPSVTVLDVKTVRFASPVKTSGARHVARKAGKVYPVILKAPPRSTSAVLVPRAALATVKIRRTSSLKTVGSGVKGKKDEEKEKENLGGKRNSDRRSSNNNNKPARFIARFPKPS